MLIGNASKKPSLQQVRRIKKTLGQVLELPEGVLITVTQLACLEENCAPLETVIGLLRPNEPQLQYKIHKATDDVAAKDLILVCKAWGYHLTQTSVEAYFKEN